MPIFPKNDSEYQMRGMPMKSASALKQTVSGTGTGDEDIMREEASSKEKRIMNSIKRLENKLKKQEEGSSAYDSIKSQIETLQGKLHPFD